jgi:hypothetical protein
MSEMRERRREGQKRRGEEGGGNGKGRKEEGGHPGILKKIEFVRTRSFIYRKSFCVVLVGNRGWEDRLRGLWLPRT